MLALLDFAARRWCFASILERRSNPANGPGKFDDFPHCQRQVKKGHLDAKLPVLRLEAAGYVLHSVEQCSGIISGQQRLIATLQSRIGSTVRPPLRCAWT
jgi:hypothetical protein